MPSRQSSLPFFLNDLFDALNRRFPAEGLKLGCKDFSVLEAASVWLDSWETEVVKGEISKDVFLTQSTAEGLRVTIKSVRELSVYLLKECGFKYVLTAKMNQDPLECFFRYRQASWRAERTPYISHVPSAIPHAEPVFLAKATAVRQLHNYWKQASFCCHLGGFKKYLQ